VIEKEFWIKSIITKLEFLERDLKEIQKNELISGDFKVKVGQMVGHCEEEIANLRLAK